MKNWAFVPNRLTKFEPTQKLWHLVVQARDVVDLADFAVLGDCMLVGGPEFEAERICRFSFDINLDFFVDMHDVALFLNLFQGTSGNRTSAKTTDDSDR